MKETLHLVRDLELLNHLLKLWFSDSKFDNVDRDWIDMKSNNYINNEEYQNNKKVTKSKKPEWKNVYSKDNLAPAEGAVNAFQYQHF